MLQHMLHIFLSFKKSLMRLVRRWVIHLKTLTFVIFEEHHVVLGVTFTFGNSS